MYHISQVCKLVGFRNIAAKFPVPVVVEIDPLATLYILQLPTTRCASLIPFDAIEHQVGVVLM